MRPLLVAGLLIAVVPSLAEAADLPVMVPAAVPAAPAFNWTGLYGGLHVGGRWAEHNDIMFMAPTGTTFTGTTSSSVVGGVHAGYNFQLNPNVLIGIEADISYGRNEASLTGVGPATVGPTTVQLNTPQIAFDTRTTVTTTLTQRMASELDWSGSLRGRIGFTNDRLLVYLTGGLALGNIEVNLAQTAATSTQVQVFRTVGNNLISTTVTAGTGPTLTASRSQIRAGWTIGGGAEFALDQNWLVRGEYLYADYGRVSVSLTDGSSASARIETHTARIGVSYRIPPQ
jgi:outer membrane immunogenic protein